MAFVKIDRNNFELISLLLRPNVHFVSSSSDTDFVVTGSQHVAPVRSKCIKQVIDLESSFNNLVADIADGVSNISKYNIDNFARAVSLHEAQTLARGTPGSYELTGSLARYLDLIDEAPKDVRFDKKIDVLRFDPPFKYTKNSTVKNVIRNIMMPEHRHRYDNCGFWYSNYNSLNFFDNDVVPSGSCLIYPNVDNCYGLEQQFSLNFWINPRYSKVDSNGEYLAGTIFHMSSSMAVSLVSGSDKDIYGEPQDFKILLQLSRSADVNPTSVSLGTPSTGVYPRDLIFTSSSTLKKNHWHHVCIQWSAISNNRTGSIFIDDNETSFYYPSASIGSASAVPASYSIPASPTTIIGNYFKGTSSENSKLLHQTVSGSEGVYALDVGSENPVIDAEMFEHPLQAELHDIRLYDTFYDRGYGNTFGAKLRFESPKNATNLKMWIPPYFFPETPNREVLLTPFQKSPGTDGITDKTADPFNVQFSFGVGGKLINLENFVRDFAQSRNPRLLFLTASTIPTTIENITADQYVYESHFDPNFEKVLPTALPTGSLIKRNMTIMPCDNGLFMPHYDVLENSYLSGSELFKKPNGISDYSIISLERLIPTSSLYPGLIFEGGSIFEDIVGSSPDNPGVAPGSVLTIAQRTKDVSSNEISVFDISNLYYGNRIHPRSFELYEPNLTGSQGSIKIRLRDNGRGSIYRADAETKHAEWNSVGNILYEEGIVVLKSPHLFYFNKDKTDMKFKGEQNIHTMIVNVPANEWNFTSSSNATYESIPPTTGANDVHLDSVYITGVNIHDENLNIIAKANFAQPIVKTQEDEFVIRLKQDF